MPHTPGPWTATAVTDAKGQLGYRIDSKDISLMAWVPVGYGDGPAAENARLMAAAPDLLAELKAQDELHFAIIDACKRAEQGGLDTTELRRARYDRQDARRALITAAEKD
jgi:hypothetical protein